MMDGLVAMVGENDRRILFYGRQRHQQQCGKPGFGAWRVCFEGTRRRADEQTMGGNGRATYTIEYFGARPQAMMMYT